MQSLRISKARYVLGGLTLACAALGACSDPGISSPPPPPVPQIVQVSYCAGLEPQWVAFQDGDGPWTRVVPTGAGGHTSFQYGFQTSRGGIARVTLAGGGLTVLSVLYGAPAELATAGDTRALFCGNTVSKTLLGTVVGLGADESAVVSGGFLSHITTTLAEGGRFALKALPSGPHDLIATRTVGATGAAAVTGIILRRDLDFPDSTMLAALDFTSLEAFAPATATLTLNGIGAEGASAGVRVITSTAEVRLSPVDNPSPDAVRPYSALPLAQLRPSDIQVLFASGVTATEIRGAQLYFRSASDRTLTLPAPVERPTLRMVATTPLLRPGAAFLPQGDYDRAATITYQQGTTTIVSVSMTAGYAAQTVVGGYDLVVPDLSGTSGFDPAWALHPGGPLLWTAVRTGGTLGLGVDAVPSDGATQRTGQVSGIIPGS